MSSSTKIEKLDDLLERYSGKKVKRTEIRNLTGQGENFGSVMLKVDAVMEGPEGEEETLHLVAKCIPEEEHFRQMFQVHISVNAEIKFYTDIVTTLQEFQRERGVTDVIDCFAKFYGGRVNLEEEGDEIDDHAMLLFENLKTAGFRNVDRHVGFNFEEAKLVLRDLAVFHAVPLAVKVLKPQLFEEKIKKYCCTTYGGNGVKLGTIFTDMLEDQESCRQHLEKVKRLIEGYHTLKAIVADEMFATLSHADMWVNNTMQRFEDGRAVENKLVDFQEYRYDSVVRDLSCFLITSCQTEVLQQHGDQLIDHYYHHFVQTLSRLGCDTSLYTPEKFSDEMKKYAPRSLPGGMMFTTFVVMGKRKSDPQASPFDKNLRKEDVPEDVKRRLASAVNFYAKRGWL